MTESLGPMAPFENSPSRLQFIALTKDREAFARVMQAREQEVREIARHQDGYRRNILHYVVRAGWAEFIAPLIAMGADPNAQDDDGCTPLHLASGGSKYAPPAEQAPAIVAALLATGADTALLHEKEGLTALHLAIAAEKEEAVGLLLAHGASVTQYALLPGCGNKNAFHFAAESTPAIMRLLLAHPDHAAAADFYEDMQQQLSALRLATRRGDTDMIDLLLGHGISINEKDGAGAGILHDLCQHREDREKSLPTLRLLVARGADVEKAVTRIGETPLHAAARHGYPEAVALFLGAGADPNHPNRSGETPLHLAAETYNESSVFLLLDAGANIEARTTNGETPLHVAAHRNRLAPARILVERGADVFARDRKGRTPDALCLADFQHNVRELIQEKQKKLEVRQKEVPALRQRANRQKQSSKPPRFGR